MSDNESAGTDTSEETIETTTSAATRRRAASRPAGPPPEIDDTPAMIAPEPSGGSGGVDQEAEPEAVVTAENAEVGSGGVIQRAEARPEEAEEAPVAETENGAEGEPSPAEEAGSGGVPEHAEEPAPPKKRATRSRAKKTEEGTETQEAEETKGRRGRTRRQTAENTAPPVPEPPSVPTVPAVPALEPALEPDSEPGIVGVPSVTFQPPMVVFQPPQAVPRAAAPPKHAQVEDESEDIEPVDLDEDEENGDRPRRRRRRGGRGRGKTDKARDGAEDEDEGEGEEDGAAAEEMVEEAKPARSRRQRSKADKAEKAAEKTEAEPEAEVEETEQSAKAGSGGVTRQDEDEEGTSRRRRRRRRRSGAVDVEDQAPDDPPHTVVHVRSGRAADVREVNDEVQSVKGSTRLEAKKQRRREGREQGRRRPPVITESEFLARRESVKREMVIRQHGERTQIGVLEDDVLVEHYVDRASHQSYVGNVYLGKVQNVLPSMEAAFVDIGKGRNAVLYAGEVNWDVAGLVGQPRRIESALRSGQSVLVQVTKDPVGHKGARLTSQVSLPGRYLVYVPDGSMTGISRKLPDKERARLKQVLKKIMPDNAGVIVRTAAEGATEEELEGDISRLAAQWEHIQRQAKSATAPALLHGEPDLTIRVVRDIFNEDFSKLVVSGEAAWDTVSEYVRYVAPHLADRLERWDGPAEVLGAFRIDEQIAKALERKVWLPSGGSLVIDRTEAMTVVDVNTGKFTGQGGNLEETVTRNNLEAAEEIVRQLRLRDVGGIIVIDFIDMVLESNRELVLRRLLECLSRDRTKHQVAEVTSLGLVQMTRKRVGQGLLEAFSEVCECCNGRGIHVQTTPVEHTPDKNGSAAASGRRRKRKGEIEKTVEEKLARQEPAKRPAAKREPGPPPEPDELPEQAAEEAAREAVDTPAPASLEPVEPEPVDPEPVEEAGPGGDIQQAPEEPPATSNGRRRRARRTRTKAEAVESAVTEG